MKKLSLVLSIVTLSIPWTVAIAGNNGNNSPSIPQIKIQAPGTPLGNKIRPQPQLIKGISFGGNGSGGGDICENRLKMIRGDLRAWINRRGSQDLKLPTGVSSTQYSEQMLEQLNQAKITCVGPGDSEYPVSVYNRPKVCRFTNSPESRIVCDHNKFLNLAENDQYTLVHHEYAGLAGIENPSGADSNYDVSNQISAFLVDTVVKRLAVKEDSSHERKITCFGSQDYYPTEITLSVHNKKVLDLSVKEEEGEVGQFVKSPKSPNIFSYTSNKLLINYIVTLSDDLRTAAYTVVHKNSGEALSSENLTCQ